MKGALSGITCLDFAMGVAGPHVGMLCAQHGAEVTKIETQEGDWSRTLGTPHGDLSAYATVYNRNKRSLAIDMKDSEARDILVRRAAAADVIIEAFRPGVMKKFGLDYESVRAVNPRVIYVSVTGFGQSGPMSDLPATDAVMQAFSGFMSMNHDRAGTPQRMNMVMIDMVTGLYGFQAITTALLARASTGEGAYIDCSLMKCALALQSPKLVDDVLAKGAPVMYVPLGYVATQDGGLSISVMRDPHFIALCGAMDREDVGADPRYQTRLQRLDHEDEIMRIVRAEFAKHTTDAMSARLTKAGVLHARVLHYRETVRHPQVEEASAVAWIRQDGIEPLLPVANIPGAPPIDAPGATAAPHIGQHSREILADWGIAPDRIDRMEARKVIHTPK